MMNSPKNIWILGCTGFIGTALTKRLIGNPKYILHLLLHKNGNRKMLESCNTFSGNLESFDLSWLQKYSPDIIFHLARIGGRNMLSRSLASQRGARSNERLIKQLLGMEKLPTIVYVSGSLMYGHQYNGKRADEQTPLSPVSYARQYITGELPWIESQLQKKLDIRFARPGWILGPGSWFKSFYWNHYLKRGTVPLYGNGSNLMSIVDIDECAEKIINLAEKGRPFNNLNIFSGLPITQHHFTATLAALLNATVEPISITTLRLRFGKAAAEAFTSSIPMTTCFPEVGNNYIDADSNLELILRKTISLLENK